MSGYMEGVLVLLAMNIILAYAAALPLSAGQLNLGIAGFMATGAYTSAFLSNEYGLSLWMTVPFGALAAGVVALIIGFPILRTHGIYLALATFSLGEILRAVFLNLDVVGGASGYAVYEYIEPWVFWVAAGGVFVFVFLLSQTRFNLYLTAIKNDATVAGLFGLNIHFLKVAAFALGATIAGFGGAIYAHHFSFIEAQYFNPHLNIFIVLFVLLGGVQTVYGPLFGALFFTLAPELLRFSGEWRFVLFAALIVVAMAWRSEGLITSAFVRGLFRRKERTL